MAVYDKSVLKAVISIYGVSLILSARLICVITTELLLSRVHTYLDIVLIYSYKVPPSSCVRRFPRDVEVTYYHRIYELAGCL